LNRPKAVLAKSLPDPETRLSYSVFGQAFDELHFLEPSALRMAYTHPMDDGQERTFKVKFEGEGVDDYGGPYREFFSQICEELQALNPDIEDDEPECVLPLLIPTPNQKRRTGESQNHFIINPKTSRLTGGSSQLYLEMYHFVGQFLGIALRSNVHLDLLLPSIVWKALVGESLEWEDLELFDSSSCHVLRELISLCDTGVLEEESDDLIQEILDELSWSATISDGSEVDVRTGLIKDDKDDLVTEKWNIDKIIRYCKGNIKCRLLESQAALRAMSEGLRSVVPACALGIFSWYELELRVCGRSEIDINLLKRNTEYDDDVSETEPAIVWLWEVLEEFDHRERCDFLRFVWARAHLPPTAAEFKQKFKIQSPVTDGARQTPDLYLPKAHTCFFSINLPRYSSKKILKDKLVYAMNNCLALDADFRLAGGENTGWVLPTPN
jgi:hypothetical protein